MSIAKKIQYIFDNKGKKSYVVLPVKLFDTLMENFEDIEEAKLRKKEPKISFATMKKKLEKRGKL
jgi:hypothetical protein